MQMLNEMGTPTVISGSGVSTVTSGNAALLGFMANSGTPGTIQLSHGATTGNFFTGSITPVTGVFTRVPAYCSGGLTVLLTGWTSPNLTLYWKPMGGNATSG